MIGIVPAALALGGGVGGVGPPAVTLVSPAALDAAVALTRATPGLALGADGATWSEIAASLPRFHGASRRLLIEGARTNGERNPRFIGAAAGTPGTNPTHMAVAASNGIGRSVVGFGTENGLPYLDVRWFGTATATTYPSIVFETTTAIAASQGQILTPSAFVSLVAGSTSGVSNFNLGGYETTSAGAFLATNAATFPAPTTGNLGAKRVSSPRTVGQATCAFLQPIIFMTVPNGSSIDLTLRFGAPSCGQAPFAPSPILPPAGTIAATTRDADVPAWALPAGYPAQGTAVIKAVIPQPAPGGLDQGLFQLDDGTDANRVVLRNAAGGSTVTAAIVSGGTTQAGLSGGAATPGTAFKAALAWGPSGCALCLSGGAVVSAATAPPLGLARLLIGHASAALNRALNGEIETLTMRPARLPDADVQALANAP